MDSKLCGHADHESDGEVVDYFPPNVSRIPA